MADDDPGAGAHSFAAPAAHDEPGAGGAPASPVSAPRDAAGSGLDGGGALSARALALAADVVADAAGRAAAGWDGAAGARAQGLALARRALALGVANEEAYRPARAALAGELPSAPAATRDYLLGDLVERAAHAPLELARAAADTAMLAALVADHAPGPAAADAIAAAAIATGVARAATHLVAVNLATRSGDARLARHEARCGVPRARCPTACNRPAAARAGAPAAASIAGSRPWPDTPERHPWRTT